MPAPPCSTKRHECVHILSSKIACKWPDHDKQTTRQQQTFAQIQWCALTDTFNKNTDETHPFNSFSLHFVEEPSTIFELLTMPNIVLLSLALFMCSKYVMHLVSNTASPSEQAIHFVFNLLSNNQPLKAVHYSQTLSLHILAKQHCAMEALGWTQSLRAKPKL